MSSDIEEAVSYFKKVIKYELGIQTEEAVLSVRREKQPPQPTPTEPAVPESQPAAIPQPTPVAVQVEAAERPETISVETPERQEVTTPEPPTPAPQPIETPSLSVPTKELSMEAITPDIMDVSHALMNEIRALKEMLLDKIARLEQRVSSLEKMIPQLTKSIRERPTARAPVPVEHRFYVEETEILIKEAQELLRSTDITLSRLIKLEAVEWQILKACEQGASVDEKAVGQILKSLRMEINRLRRNLLG